MQADLVIKNARVVDFRGEFVGGLAATAGKIDRVIFEAGEVDENAFGTGRCLTRPD